MINQALYTNFLEMVISRMHLIRLSNQDYGLGKKRTEKKIVSVVIDVTYSRDIHSIITCHTMIKKFNS